MSFNFLSSSFCLKILNHSNNNIENFYNISYNLTDLTCLENGLSDFYLLLAILRDIIIEKNKQKNSSAV